MEELIELVAVTDGETVIVPDGALTGSGRVAAVLRTPRLRRAAGRERW